MTKAEKKEAAAEQFAEEMKQLLIENQESDRLCDDAGQMIATICSKVLVWAYHQDELKYGIGFDADVY